VSVEISKGDGVFKPQPLGPRNVTQRPTAIPSRTRRARRSAAPADRREVARPAPTSTDQVVGALVHELRAPVATLHAGLEVLSDYPDLDSDEVRRLVSRLQRGVAWLDCLIENLTTWSAIGAGCLTLRKGEGAVLGWIEPAIDLVQPLLARRGQRVRLVCAIPPPTLRVDSVRLGQVVVNLLINAGKYGVEGDEVVLTVEAVANGVRVSVADHGMGIPPAEQEAIFRPHTYGAAAATAGVAGHGLGLSIVKAIVEAHGGTVGVISAPGAGATFWFTIPSDE
jgi:signal transduction histidine kinase